MTRPRVAFAIGVGLLAITTTACGGDDKPTTAGAGDDTRTIEIDMADNAFEPDEIAVERGETVRFVFTNTGEVAHDAFIGGRDAQADHEAEMREAHDGGHSGGHGDESDDAVTVGPGESGELTYRFNETGTLEVGCHQPGHYAAGMKLVVEVA